jgi:hypothetical protein
MFLYSLHQGPERSCPRFLSDTPRRMRTSPASSPPRVCVSNITSGITCSLLPMSLFRNAGYPLDAFDATNVLVHFQNVSRLRRCSWRTDIPFSLEFYVICTIVAERKSWWWARWFSVAGACPKETTRWRLESQWLDCGDSLYHPTRPPHRRHY